MCMILTTPTSIEDHIVSLLRDGPIGTVELISHIRKYLPKATKQAVYAALRKLKGQEVVVVHNKQASLSIQWLRKLELFVNIAEERSFDAESRSNGILALTNGDRIEYHFKNAHLMDSFWWHASALLLETQSAQEPVYIYHTHEWFLHARRNTELGFIRYIKDNRRTLFLAVSRNTPLDKLAAKDFDGTTAQYYMYSVSPFPKNNYYLNVFNDYIFEVWLDKSMSSELDALYRNTKTITPEILEQIKSLTSKPGKSRMIISRNTKRAEKLKKLLGKHFFVPKEYRSKKPVEA